MNSALDGVQGEIPAATANTGEFIAEVAVQGSR
jgi:hypothetical protein